MHAYILYYIEQQHTHNYSLSVFLAKIMPFMWYTVYEDEILL